MHVHEWGLLVCLVSPVTKVIHTELLSQDAQI